MSKWITTLSIGLALLSSPGVHPQISPDFSGIWQQDVSRSVPQRDSKRTRELTIRQTGQMLTVKITQTGSHPGSLDLKYNIGGQELVYTGLDGDEFHTKVHQDGASLVFETIEHERGKQFVSKQTWTLVDSGKTLQEVKQGGEAGKAAESVTIYNRVLKQ